MKNQWRLSGILVFIILLSCIFMKGVISARALPQQEYQYADSDTGYVYYNSPEYNSIDDLILELKNDPNNYSVRIKLAKEFYLRHNPSKALEIIRPLAESEILQYEDQSFYDNLLYNYQDSLRKDIDRYWLLLETMPINKIAVNIITQNETELFEFDKSVSILERYLDLNGQDDEIRMRLVQTAFYLKDYKLAMKHALILQNKYPDEEQYENLVNLAASKTNNPEISYEDYFYETEREDGLLNLAIIEYHKSDIDNALNNIADAEGSIYDSPEVAYIINKANLEDAVPEEVARDINIDYIQEANNSRDTGNCARAASFLQKQLLLTPGDKFLHYKIGDDFYCAGMYKEAIKSYDDFLLYRGDRDTRFKRAYCFVKMKDYLDALDEFKELSVMYPGDKEILTELARLYHVTGLYKNSRETYAQIVDENSTDFTLYDESQKVPAKDQRINGARPHYLKYKKDIVRHLSVEPVFRVYNDNEEFALFMAGSAIKLKMLRYFTTGLKYTRSSVENQFGGINYSNVHGFIKIVPTERITITSYFGGSMFENDVTKNHVNAMVSFKTKMVDARFDFIESDAINIMQDRNLVFLRLAASKVGGQVKVYLKRGITFTGKYHVIETDGFVPEAQNVLKVSDNIGNELMLKGSMLFEDGFSAGYIYRFSDFRHTLSYYYSPQLTSTHLIYGKTPKYDLDLVNASFYGGLGFYKETGKLTKELGFMFDGIITNGLLISGEGKISWNYRYNARYNHRDLVIYLQYGFN